MDKNATCNSVAALQKSLQDFVLSQVSLAPNFFFPKSHPPPLLLFLMVHPLSDVVSQREMKFERGNVSKLID